MKRPPRSLRSLPAEGAGQSLGAALRPALHVPKVRNPVARSPLLGKGGPHGKTTRARRRQDKVELSKIVRETDGQD